MSYFSSLCVESGAVLEMAGDVDDRMMVFLEAGAVLDIRDLGETEEGWVYYSTGTTVLGDVPPPPSPVPPFERAMTFTEVAPIEVSYGLPALAEGLFLPASPQHFDSASTSTSRVRERGGRAARGERGKGGGEEDERM